MTVKDLYRKRRRDAPFWRRRRRRPWPSFSNEISYVARSELQSYEPTHFDWGGRVCGACVHGKSDTTTLRAPLWRML